MNETGLWVERAKVVITDLNEDAGQALAAGLGDNAMFVPQNVAYEENWNTVVQAARDTLGRIDMLANNAGILLMKGVEEATVDEFNRIMTINVGGVFFGTKAVAAIIRQQGGSAIIDKSSPAGMVGQVQTVAYSASKSDAMDSRLCGLRVISIHPGSLATPMTAQLGAAPDAPLPLVPLNRPGAAILVDGCFGSVGRGAVLHRQSPWPGITPQLFRATPLKAPNLSSSALPHCAAPRSQASAL